MTEEWRTIEGYEGRYEVSNMGRVRSLDRLIEAHNERMGWHKRFWKGRILKSSCACNRYPSIGLLNEDGERRTREIHRLVAEAFLGPPPSAEHEVAHGDGDKTNNQVSNLRWATRKENLADRELHGTSQHGENGPRAILTDDLVRQIRKHGSYQLDPVYAEKFGVRPQTVTQARLGFTWKHLE